jgi:hypothetical protein
MQHPLLTGRDRLALTAVGGCLLIAGLMLLICERRGQSLSECDKGGEIGMLTLGATTAAFAYLSKAPD